TPKGTEGVPTAIFRGDWGSGPFLEFYEIDFSCLSPSCTNPNQIYPRATRQISDLCGGRSASTVSVFPSVRDSLIQLTLLLDHRFVCVVDVDLHGWGSPFKSNVFDIVQSISDYKAHGGWANFDTSATIGQPGLLDLDGDKRSDLVVPLFWTKPGDSGPHTAFLYWLRNGANSTFASVYADEPYTPSMVAGSAADVLGVADFNRDGKEDPIIAGTAYRSRAFLGHVSFDVEGTYQYPTVRP